MGLFDDAGIDDSELSLGLKDGKHPGRLSDVSREEIRTGNGDETRPNLVFAYMVDGFEFPVKKFFPILVGKRIENCDDTDDSFNTYKTARGEVRQTEQAYWKAQYRALKAWLVRHGVDEGDVNKVDPADLVDTRVIVETKQNNRGYANVMGVTVEGASGATLPTKPASTVTNSASVTAPASAPSVPAGTPMPNPFAKQS